MQRLLEDFQRKDRRSLAKLITLIENDSPLKEEIIKKLHFTTKKARIIGFTGSPGAGKSSLIDRLVKTIRQRGETVGIIAVDPTSPFSGGAMLGDRIRMQEHALDEGVYIRSMGTRGNLGGLARSTKDVVKVLNAYGKDWIIVETVGVGQAELEIMNIASTTTLVLTPDSGDGIQTIKAGIMEIADIFAVNKCDLPGADRVATETEMMLDMQYHKKAWRPPVIMTSSVTGEGVNELLEAINEHHRYLQENNIYLSIQKEKAITEILDIISSYWQKLICQHLNGKSQVSFLLEKVANQKMDPYTAATKIIEILATPGSLNTAEGKKEMISDALS
ncbi:methylmalonyl Co-A mutase-associated GTPase MeaB [Desulfallas sp. Bu1-1]|uniref:methylmalonyl Co-A mutase-associated GTPase MeaB n=1 Tax=Desulfallas sp. Bu1-1 TaxID=2787620 RepID=UPI001FAE2A8D|nr:methylmalonyl Co-A mutase-associated GTPase MeaB [Desulfallas sp. Bu1-1]